MRPFRTMLFSLMLVACEGPLPRHPDADPGSEPSTKLQDIQPHPELTIGMITGEDEYLFNRIEGGVRMPDGGVAVAVQGYNQVRRYDPNGAHLWTVGRSGEGTG